MQDREILYFLQTLNGIGDITTNRLWEYFGDWNRVFDASERELQPLLKPSQLRTFLREREKRNLVEELKCLEQRGIFYYSKMDEKYPNRLKCITDAPNGIFVRGKLPKEDGLSIAIVGTRRHSYYGEKQTKQFSRIIAERGIPVISGMARGIDGIAQQGAVESNGESFAVLGSGADVCYPKENRELYVKLQEKGGIISEYEPGTEPESKLFPPRNRIISGLADMILVIEARKRSGTYITVLQALEQGKEVYAVPGRITDSLSDGCNYLLSQGAGVAISPESIIEALSQRYTLALGKNEPIGSNMSDVGQENKEQENDIILSSLEINPIAIEELHHRVKGKIQIDMAQLVLILTKLQISGKVIGVGEYYRLANAL